MVAMIKSQSQLLGLFLLYVLFTVVSCKLADNACKDSLWKTGKITNMMLKSSSHPTSLKHSGLDCCNGTDTGGWCGDKVSRDNWLEVDFPQATGIRGVVIQSPEDISKGYVKSIQLEIQQKSLNTWIPIGNSIPTNFTSHGKLTISLQTGYMVNKLRIKVTDFQKEPCLRFDVIGCKSGDLCPDGCMNGGTCLYKDSCECTPGYTGDRCEVKVGGCNAPLGMRDGSIPNEMLSVSSHQTGKGKEKARYGCCEGEHVGAWCPNPNDKNPWYQVVLPRPRVIQTLSFQHPGRENNAELPDTYMKNFKLEFVSALDPERNWRTFSGGIPAIYNNTVHYDISLKPSIVTDKIRIYPETYVKAQCFRFELLGCDPTVLCPANWCHNGGKCVGDHLCQCTKGFSGDQCQNSVTTMTNYIIHFKQITQTTITTTTSLTFQIHGTVSLETENQKQVLHLTGSNSYTTISNSNFTSCLVNIDGCSSGFTVSLNANFLKITDNTFIISSGGNIPGTKGFALYYRQHKLYCSVTTSSKTWTLQIPFVLTTNVWKNFEFSWSKTLGLELYIDHVFKASVTQSVPTTATQTKQIAIGYGHQTQSVSIDMKIEGLKTYDLSRSQLVREGIVTKQPTTVKPTTTAPRPTTMKPVPTTSTGIKMFNFTFIGIHGNILYTPTFNFTVYGSPKLRPEPDGSAILVLNTHGQYVELPNKGLECVEDINTCDKGFTFQVEVKILEYSMLNKTYIFSSGGDKLNSSGVALFLWNGELYCSTKRDNLIWAAKKNVTFDVTLWHKFQVSWNKNDGFIVYVDGVHFMTSMLRYPTAAQPNTHELLIANAFNASTTTKMEIKNLFTWTASRDVLITEGVITEYPTTQAPSTTTAPKTTTTTVQSNGFKILDFTFIKIVSKTLVTPSMNFTVFGNPILIPDNHGNNVLVINKTGEYVELPDNGLECLIDISKCQKGFTLKADIKILVQTVQSTRYYIFSSGGDQAGTTGIALYLDNNKLCSTARSRDKLWTTCKAYTFELTQWHTYQISWNPKDGYYVFVDGMLFMRPNLIIQLQLQTGIHPLLIGGSFSTNITTFMTIKNLYTWTASREILIQQGVIEEYTTPPPTVATTQYVKQTTCGKYPADIVFVIDESSSIGNRNFLTVKTFVKNLIKDLMTDSGKYVQIGLLTFASRSTNQFWLNQYSTADEIFQAIDRIKYGKRGTDIADGLKFARENSFSKAHGARDGASKILILFTDGYSSNTDSEAQKVHDAGITTMVIGVTKDVNEKQLSKIASKPSYLKHVDNFDGLDAIKEAFLKEIPCEEGNKNVSSPKPYTVATTKRTLTSTQTLSQSATTTHTASVSSKLHSSVNYMSSNFEKSTTSEPTTATKTTSTPRKTSKEPVTTVHQSTTTTESPHRTSPLQLTSRHTSKYASTSMKIHSTPQQTSKRLLPITSMLSTVNPPFSSGKSTVLSTSTSASSTKSLTLPTSNIYKQSTAASSTSASSTNSLTLPTSTTDKQSTAVPSTTASSTESLALSTSATYKKSTSAPSPSNSSTKTLILPISSSYKQSTAGPSTSISLTKATKRPLTISPKPSTSKLSTTVSSMLISSSKSETLSKSSTSKQQTSVSSTTDNVHQILTTNNKELSIKTNFSFLSIQNNIVITPSLNFTIHGSPSLVKEKNGSSLILLNGTSQSYIGFSKTKETKCVNDVSDCDTGFTVKINMNFQSFDYNKKVFILSNGGESEGSTGISLYCYQRKIYAIVRTNTKSWTVHVPVNINLHTWHVFELSWKLTSGLDLLMDNTPIGSCGHFIYQNSTGTSTSLLVGTSILTSSYSAIVKVGQLQYWPLTRTLLVQNGVLNKEIPKYEWNLVTSTISQTTIIGSKFNLTVQGGAQMNASHGIELTSTNQFIDFGIHQNLCVGNLSLCYHGITIQMTVMFMKLEENTVILTSGGDKTDGTGIALVYRYGRVQCVVSNTTVSWYATISRETLSLFHIHTILISWSNVHGLKIIVDNHVIQHTTSFVAHHEIKNKPEHMCIGSSISSSTQIDYFVKTVTIWHVWIGIIIDVGEIAPPIDDTTTTVATTNAVPATTEYCKMGWVCKDKMTTRAPTTTKKPTTTRKPTTRKPTTTQKPTTTRKPTTTTKPKPVKPTTPNKPHVTPGVDSHGSAYVQCKFVKAVQPNVEYIVYLNIDGVRVLTKKVSGKYESVQFTVSEINDNLNNKKITCSIQAHFVGQTILTTEMISSIFIPKIQLISHGKIVLIEGHRPKPIQVSMTGPPQMFCCKSCKGYCQVHIIVHANFDRHYTRCHNAYIPQVLVGWAGEQQSGKPDTCGTTVRPLSWNTTIEIPITANADMLYDRDHTGQFTVQAKIIDVPQPVKPGFVATPHTLEVGKIQVQAKNNDHKSTCGSLNDPHITTFDRKRYDNFIEGEFTLYRHKTLPFEVRAKYSKCSNGRPRHGHGHAHGHGSRATCNCAVAIKSGDDVITFTGCGSNAEYWQRHFHRHPPITVEMYKNGELTPGTLVRRIGCGQKYEVRLPTGTFITIQQSFLSFINIWIRPSSIDYGNTEGLCGMYDRNPNNDVIDGNGRPVPGRYPDKFSLMWRARLTLFGGVQASASTGITTFCSCVDTKKTYCLGSYGAMQCWDPRYDITQTLVKQAKVPQHGRHKRQAATTNNNAVVGTNEDNTTYAMNRSEAYEKCTKFITNNAAAKSCNKYLTALSNESTDNTERIENCALDLMITGDDEWTRDHVRDIVEECLSESERRPAPVNTTNNNTALPTENPLANDLENMCLEDCGTYGTCKQGVCDCNAGYSGEYCNISSSTKPSLATVPMDGMGCDMRVSDDCKQAVIFGDNFVQSEDLTCHYQYIQVGQDVRTIRQPGTVDAIYVSITQVICPLPDIKDTNGAYIRVSNDKTEQSDEVFIHLIYDSVCFDCEIENKTDSSHCARRPNTCIINGQCFAANSKKADNECKVCDPSNDNDRWTDSDATSCIAKPVQVTGNEETEKRNKTIIMILGIVCGALGFFLLFSLACICKLRSKYHTKEFGDYGVSKSPYESLHRTQYPQTLMDNPTYEEKM